MKRADGIILVDVRVPADEAAVLVDGRVEVVTVGVELAGTSSVMVDDFDIARDSVAHLLDLGHTKIASLDGRPDDALLFTVPAERQRGYVAALTDAGVAVRDEYHVVGDFSVDGGRRAMAALLDLDDPPTAVFSMSDEMAFGALHELRSRGLRSPDHMSIIGIDDHDLAAIVGLTTTHQQVTEHGAIAARMLLEQMATPGIDPRRQSASTRFVERETTGPLTG